MDHFFDLTIERGAACTTSTQQPQQPTHTYGVHPPNRSQGFLGPGWLAGAAPLSFRVSDEGGIIGYRTIRTLDTPTPNQRQSRTDQTTFHTTNASPLTGSQRGAASRQPRTTRARAIDLASRGHHHHPAQAPTQPSHRTQMASIGSGAARAGLAELTQAFARMGRPSSARCVRVCHVCARLSFWLHAQSIDRDVVAGGGGGCWACGGGGVCIASAPPATATSSNPFTLNPLYSCRCPDQPNPNP